MMKRGFCAIINDSNGQYILCYGLNIIQEQQVLYPLVELKNEEKNGAMVREKNQSVTEFQLCGSPRHPELPGFLKTFPQFHHALVLF